MKKYKVGMYGGKFLPFHKGHFHCLQRASEECELVYCVLVTGGFDEKRILSERKDDFLQPSSRIEAIKKICEDNFDNVKFATIDVTDCVKEDGSEDWEGETPLMVEACEGHTLNAVYGSEPAYKAYFNNAYPFAEYVLVDIDRKEVPISATMIRNMDEKERKKWMV